MKNPQWLFMVLTGSALMFSFICTSEAAIFDNSSPEKIAESFFRDVQNGNIKSAENKLSSKFKLRAGGEEAARMIIKGMGKYFKETEIKSLQTAQEMHDDYHADVEFLITYKNKQNPPDKGIILFIRDGSKWQILDIPERLIVSSFLYLRSDKQIKEDYERIKAQIKSVQNSDQLYYSQRPGNTAQGNQKALGSVTSEEKNHPETLDWSNPWDTYKRLDYQHFKANKDVNWYIAEGNKALTYGLKNAVDKHADNWPIYGASNLLAHAADLDPRKAVKDYSQFGILLSKKKDITPIEIQLALSALEFSTKYMPDNVEIYETISQLYKLLATKGIEIDKAKNEQKAAEYQEKAKLIRDGKHINQVN